MLSFLLLFLGERKCKCHESTARPNGVDDGDMVDVANFPIRTLVFGDTEDNGEILHYTLSELRCTMGEDKMYYCLTSRSDSEIRGGIQYRWLGSNRVKMGKIKAWQFERYLHDLVIVNKPISVVEFYNLQWEPNLQVI